MKRELQILFHALCDGLRQEVRQRSLANLITDKYFSLTNEREVGIASILASHLRSVGFIVQLDAYFVGEDKKLRPDFGIFLPASKKYIYLELKLTAWGDGFSYSYDGAINDIKKLNRLTHPDDQLNGLIALGLSRFKEMRVKLTDRANELSQKITDGYPYEKIGLEEISLENIDRKSSYALIGLWFRKHNKGTEE